MDKLTKQQLAQKRNYFKFVLTGLIKPIDLNCLTIQEQAKWKELIRQRDTLLKEFDENSIKQGLNVPKKCWCSKPVWNNTNYCKEHQNTNKYGGENYVAK